MIPHKRYLVFAFEDYYPGGGLVDCEASFDTEQECADYILGTNNFSSFHWQVYDRIEGVEIDVKIEES